jgi:hypothetical protein
MPNGTRLCPRLGVWPPPSGQTTKTRKIVFLYKKISKTRMFLLNLNFPSIIDCPETLPGYPRYNRIRSDIIETRPIKDNALQSTNGPKPQPDLIRLLKLTRPSSTLTLTLILLCSFLFTHVKKTKPDRPQKLLKSSESFLFNEPFKL